MLPAFKWLSVLLFILVAVQPILGGEVIYRDRDILTVHAMVANTIFLVVLVLAGLSFFAGFSRKTRMVGTSLLLLVMVTAQIGLGYAAEGRPNIAALHIPMGVFTFGVTLLLMLFAFGFSVRRETA